VIAALNIGARAEAADVATMTGSFLDRLQEAAAELTGFLV
jgi:hypothetical protein